MADGGSQLPILACYLVCVCVAISRSAAFFRKCPNLANTYFVSHPTESVQHTTLPPPPNRLSLTCETKLTVAWIEWPSCSPDVLHLELHASLQWVVAYLHTPSKFALCTASCCLENASDLALEASIPPRRTSELETTQLRSRSTYPHSRLKGRHQVGTEREVTLVANKVSEVITGSVRVWGRSSTK